MEMSEIEFDEMTVETTEPQEPAPAQEHEPEPTPEPAAEEGAEAPKEGDEEKKEEEPAWKTTPKKGPPETVPYSVFSETRAEMRVLRERLEAFEQQRAAQGQPQQQQASIQPEGLPPKPKMEDFDSLEKYEEAKDDWLLQAGEARALQRIQGIEAQRQAEAQRIELERATVTFKERVDAAEAADPEIGQIRAYLAPVFDHLNPAVQDVIAKSENPAPLLRALAGIGRNHEELVREINSNPAAALMFLGRHSAPPAKAGGAQRPALPVIPPTRTVTARGAKNETPIDAIARKSGYDFE